MVNSQNIAPLVRLNKTTLSELKALLDQLDQAVYATYNQKGKASIGQHVRHTIEFYQCLFSGCAEVDYDQRTRDVVLETNIEHAINTIGEIQARVDLIQEDAPLTLITELPAVTSDPLRIASSWSRELFYVMEHAIHHMALIRVLVSDSDQSIELPESFGVAYSTLAHREAEANG